MNLGVSQTGNEHSPRRGEDSVRKLTVHLYIFIRYLLYKQPSGVVRNCIRVHIFCNQPSNSLKVHMSSSFLPSIRFRIKDPSPEYNDISTMAAFIGFNENS